MNKEYYLCIPTSTLPKEFIGVHGFFGPNQKEFFRFHMHPVKFMEAVKLDIRSVTTGNVTMTIKAFLRELEHIDLIYYEGEQKGAKGLQA